MKRNELSRKETRSNFSKIRISIIVCISILISINKIISIDQVSEKYHANFYIICLINHLIYLKITTRTYFSFNKSYHILSPIVIVLQHMHMMHMGSFKYDTDKFYEKKGKHSYDGDRITIILI